MALWWENEDTGDLELGATWEKGMSVAIRWYTKNPDALGQQIEALQNSGADTCAGCSQPFGEFETAGGTWSSRDRYRDSSRCVFCALKAGTDLVTLHREKAS